METGKPPVAPVGWTPSITVVAKPSSGAGWSPGASAKGYMRADLLAAAPPRDTLKSMLALSFRENLKVVVEDVKNTHLNGVVKQGMGTTTPGAYRAVGPRGGAGTCRGGSVPMSW